MSNYGKAHLAHLAHPFYSANQLIYRYAFQEESGEEGTPHLQGVVYFKNPVSFTTVKQWNLRLHVERSRDVTRSVQYCTNLEKRVGRVFTSGFDAPRDDLGLIQEGDFYDWQRALLAETGGQPHPRKIIWYYDQDGGCGKTELCRHMVANVDGTLFLTSAQGKDLVHQVVKARRPPKLVILNLSRQSEGAFSYASVESIKDGLVFSGKYEGGSKLFPRPHVVIFSNWYPDLTKLSLDRWDIRVLLSNPPRLEIQ